MVSQSTISEVRISLYKESGVAWDPEFLWINRYWDSKGQTNKWLEPSLKPGCWAANGSGDFPDGKERNLERAQSICTNKGHLSRSWALYLKADHPQGTLWRLTSQRMWLYSVFWREVQPLYLFLQACSFPRNVKHPQWRSGKPARLDLLTLCLKRCFSWVDLTSEPALRATSI